MEKDTSTIAIDADLYGAVKLMIETGIIEAPSVGAYVEELMQKDVQRRKTGSRQAGTERP